MTRLGKIARLPQAVREELNERLADGEQGKTLVAWLNGLEVVGKIMAAHFNGQPVTEQNLSHWKQGGHEDWLRHQESRAWVCRIKEEAADFSEDEGEFPLSEQLTPILGVALGKVLEKLARGPLDQPGQIRELLEAAHALLKLQKTDHRSAELRVQWERWEAEKLKNEEREYRDAEHRREWHPLLTIIEKMQRNNFIEELVAGVPDKDLQNQIRNFCHTGSTKRKPPTPVDPTQSNPIQPNPTSFSAAA